MSGKVVAFTTKCHNVENVLRNIIGISIPSSNGASKNYIDAEAIWDTGATNSVVSKSTAIALGLIPSTFVSVYGVTGEKIVPVYMVSIMLPNRVELDLPMSEGADCMGCNVLIGMDVISQGDFCVSNHGGITVFSFRKPSVKTTDYVAEINSQNTSKMKAAFPNVGRNDPCPCESGKKYKKCCGRDFS